MQQQLQDLKKVLARFSLPLRPYLDPSDMSAVICDLDDTLVATVENYYNCVCLAANNLGLPAPNWDTFLAGYGRPYEESRQIWFGASEFSWQKFRELFSAEREATIDHSLIGDDSCLKCLRGAGLKLAIATSSTEERALQKLRGAGIDATIFSAISGLGAVKHIKPAPDVILHAMNKLGIRHEDAQRVLYVGNSMCDALAAKRAGVRFCGVDPSGLWLRENLNQESYLLSSAQLLPELFGLERAPLLD